MLRNLRAFIGHLVWIVASLPGWLRFQWALRHPRRTQERVLRRLIRANRNSAFGRAHDFATIRSPQEFAERVPLADYEVFVESIDAVRHGKAFPLAAERVELLEPTSGSSAAPKLIPVTRRLRREFAAAIDPWIAWLYLAHPRLMLGPHYWAVSPHTAVPAGTGPGASAVPVGFSDDAEYLGALGRLAAGNILANPPELRRIKNPDAFTCLTLLFLLKERNLRLISVWHPSYFELLLEAIPRHLPMILTSLQSGRLPGAIDLPADIRDHLDRRFRADPRRAQELAALALEEHAERVAAVWPRLEVFSCWDGARAEPWLGRLRQLFPNASVQGKGLLATEGCVSIPTGCGRKRPCAVTSHFLEFVQPEDGKAVPMWKLTLGREYSVVLTTGGGLWRYRLHDLVRVVDFCRSTPCLEFLAKDNAVSDLVGEKLDERHVAQALAEAVANGGHEPLFAMVVPDTGGPGRSAAGYVLLLEIDPRANLQETLPRWCEKVERSLRRNYHYEHARNLGQLRPLRGVLIRDGARKYREAEVLRGSRIGTVKIPALQWRAVQAATPWWQITAGPE